MGMRMGGVMVVSFVDFDCFGASTSTSSFSASASASAAGAGI